MPSLLIVAGSFAIRQSKSNSSAILSAGELRKRASLHFRGLRGHRLTMTAATIAAKIVCKMRGGHTYRMYSEAIQKGCGPRQPQNPHSSHGTNISDISTAMPTASNVRFIRSLGFNHKAP
jgi:hypothetical protein